VGRFRSLPWPLEECARRCAGTIGHVLNSQLAGSLADLRNLVAALTDAEALLLERVRQLRLDRKVHAPVPPPQAPYERRPLVASGDAPSQGRETALAEGRNAPTPPPVRMFKESSATPPTPGLDAVRGSATPGKRDYDFFAELDDKLAALSRQASRPHENSDKLATNLSP
jgi:hypothetical protein